MRNQQKKLLKTNSTKAERKFMEILKKNHIKFQTKVRINNKEIDFLIGKYAIEINGHKQNTDKNVELAKLGYIPIHIPNKDLKKDGLHKLSWRNY